MSSLSEYLRKNYLSEAKADEPKERHKAKKKKKKSASSTGAGLRLVDEDEAAAVPVGQGNLQDIGRDMNYTILRAEDVLQGQAQAPSAPESVSRDRPQVFTTWVTVGDGEERAADGSDASPPRRRQRHDTPEHDAPGGGFADDDPSPPRRRSRHDTPEHDAPGGGFADDDPSPPRRRPRHDTPEHDAPGGGFADDDPSPPRRRPRHDTPEHDAPGGGFADDDPSPPRRRPRHDTPERAAGGGGADDDPSPPRRPVAEAGRAGRDGSGAAAAVVAGPAAPGAQPEPSAVRSFTAPGLHTDVQQEVAALEAQRRESLRGADARALGAEEETVYRDKHGKRLDYLTEMMRQQEGGAGAKPAAPAWGQGLAQKQRQEQQRAYAQAEAAKPFARYEDDTDRDVRMRHSSRWGDPLAGRVGTDKARAAAEALRPKYRGPAPPPNRFGIAPGHRWDGVDRSNGFEKEFFKMQANASLLQQQAYRMGTEDM